MQQTVHETGSQANRKVWFLGGITFFSLLLFLSIGLVVMAQDGFQDFYSKKLRELNETSIEAVMPASSDKDKILGFLDETSYVKVTDKDALYTEDIKVDLHERVATKLLILNSGRNQIHYTEGTKGNGKSVVLPYILKAYYGLKIKDSVSIIIGDETVTYVISGFFEDEILSQQNLQELLTIYLDEASYEEMKQKEGVTEELICSIQLKDSNKTSEVIEAWKQKLDEQLFIDGLDLKVYGGQGLAENIQLYLRYAKMVCFFLGLLFFVIAAVGLVMTVYHYGKYLPMVHRKITLLCFGVGAGVLVLGNIILMLIGPKVLSYLISSLGYEFRIGSVLMCILVGSIAFGIMEVLFIEIGLLALHKADRKKTSVDVRKQSVIAICKKGAIAVFVVSILLTTISLVITRLYNNTVGDSDLFYEYNEEEGMIEVFHSNQDDVEELNLFQEITDYAKPVIQVVVLGSLIGMALIYAMVLLVCLERIVEHLRQQGEKNPRSQALPILGIILGATVLAFIIAMLLAQLCMEPVGTLVRQLLGVSLEQLGMNVIVTLMVLGYFAIVASGMTLLTVK